MGHAFTGYGHCHLVRSPHIHRYAFLVLDETNHQERDFAVVAVAPSSGFHVYDGYQHRFSGSDEPSSLSIFVPRPRNRSCPNFGWSSVASGSTVSERPRPPPMAALVFRDFEPISDRPVLHDACDQLSAEHQRPTLDATLSGPFDWRRSFDDLSNGSQSIELSLEDAAVSLRRAGGFV